MPDAYMMIPINVVPPDIIQKYHLMDYVVNDKVYVEVSKGIYGLPQARKLANEQLIRHLEPFSMHLVHTPPDYAITRFHTSDMVLHVESDASYLSKTNAKSRAAGYHYLSCDHKGQNVPYPPINGPVLVTSKIIKETVSSAAEAKLAALFQIGQGAYPLHVALKEMQHPQPPTPMQTNNNTAARLANDTIKQKCSKAMSMRWFWIRDKVNANVYRKNKHGRLFFETTSNKTSH